MFTIANYFSLIFKYTTDVGWKFEKEVSEGLCKVIHPDANAYLHDTFYNRNSVYIAETVGAL